MIFVEESREMEGGYYSACPNIYDEMELTMMKNKSF
jgi:hypothetical protein